MITGIEARVTANGALQGEVRLEGTRPDVLGRFNRPPSLSASLREATDPATNQPLTVVFFSAMPGREGVRRIHELIVDDGAQEKANFHWGQELYPVIDRRLTAFGG